MLAVKERAPITGG